MESLLCNEVWLTSPISEDTDNDGTNGKNSFVWCSKEDCEEAFAAFLGKESSYLPQSGYSHFVHVHHLIADARFKAVSWIIKSQTRMDLCAETVFGAVNYLDRFISSIQCQGWKGWMFELLSIACLSIAAKLYETSSYPLHQFQEDLETSYAPDLIQRMEVMVLKSLQWRMNTITPFSYIHLLLAQTTHASTSNKQELIEYVTHFLLHLLLDPKILRFQQCVVAVSAVKTVVQDLVEDPPFSYLETLIPQHQTDDVIDCQRLMGEVLVGGGDHLLLCSGSPSSPVTVLKVGLFDSYEFAAAFSLKSGRERKRKREEVDEAL